MFPFKRNRRKVASDAELKTRWDKKKEAVSILSNHIHKLRAATTKDLNSENEKEALTALCIKIIDALGIRVGNDASADKGHFGCSDLMKSHIKKIDGNTIYLNYVGKSGVEHNQKFSNEVIAKALKRAIKNSPSEKVFVTSDGFEIPPSRINNFLSEFDVSAKDLRGYKCNRMVTDRLKDLLSNNPELIGTDLSKTEKKRKKEFLAVLTDVSKSIGHSRAMLRGSYLLPEIEPNFINNGKVVDISEEYSKGGVIGASQVTEKRRSLLDKLFNRP